MHPTTAGPDRTESVRTTDGARLHTETFLPQTETFLAAADAHDTTAESAGPAHTLLMVMGGNAPCFAFPDPLCRTIADAGYRVVRYDHRGAGSSSPVDLPERSYPLTTLASDAATVIDRLGLGTPVVYGISTGGATAQLLALDHPEKVAGLVLMATSPDYNADPEKAPEEGLPPATDEWRTLVRRMATAPATGHTELVHDYVESWRVCVGPRMPFDEEYWHGLVERTLALPDNPAPGAHQGPAIDSAPPRTERLAGVRVPTLVIHGGRDALLPPEHGRALADAIPHADLREIPELGHMFPPEFSGRLAELIVGHMSLSARSLPYGPDGPDGPSVPGGPGSPGPNGRC